MVQFRARIGLASVEERKLFGDILATNLATQMNLQHGALVCPEHPESVAEIEITVLPAFHYSISSCCCGRFRGQIDERLENSMEA